MADESTQTDIGPEHNWRRAMEAAHQELDIPYIIAPEGETCFTSWLQRVRHDLHAGYR